MLFNLLGRTGLSVSPLCAGTLAFGGDADEAESLVMYGACRDAGINFFDCADSYAGGRAETVFGKLMAHERDELVITSKCGYPVSAEDSGEGASRQHITRAVEASLKRLGTDRLDVFLMHQWDAQTPLEETLRCLEDLRRAGKVLHLGASNYAAWQVAKGLGIAERHGWARFEVVQPMYNLIKRQAESEILPLAKFEQLAVTPYSPTAGGLLSGDYRDGKQPERGRLVVNDEYAARYGEDWIMECATSFADFAEARGHHPVSLAVAWVAAHPDVTCPIIGALDVAQLRPSLNALDIEMTAELHGEISRLSRRPAPAHDRSETLNMD
jgi:aryl-alcohol dehydrogenase-like predicted oxidoreductase